MIIYFLILHDFILLALDMEYSSDNKYINVYPEIEIKIITASNKKIHDEESIG